jgi:hypothetical protein
MVVIGKAIEDVKKRFPGVYDLAIQQMLKKYIRNQNNANTK